MVLVGLMVRCTNGIRCLLVMVPVRYGEQTVLVIRTLWYPHGMVSKRYTLSVRYGINTVW